MAEEKRFKNAARSFELTFNLACIATGWAVSESE